MDSMITQQCIFLAEKYGMEYKDSSIWGTFENFPVFIRIQNDTILMNIGMTFRVEAGRRGMEELLADRSFMDKFGASYGRLTDQTIQVDFPVTDNTMAKMESMMLWITGTLGKICGVPNECLYEMTCRPKLKEKDQQIFTPKKGEMTAKEMMEKDMKIEMPFSEFSLYNHVMDRFKLIKLKDRKETYLKGTIGAFLGALVGTIPWILLGGFGWIAGWLGFVITLAAAKGYDLFWGKQEKGRLLIIIAMSVAAEFFAVAGAEVFSVGRYILNGTLSGTFANIPKYIFYTFVNNVNYRWSVRINLILGFVFVLIGSVKAIIDMIDEK